MSSDVFPTSSRDLRTSGHGHMGSLAHIQITWEITVAKKEKVESLYEFH